MTTTRFPSTLQKFNDVTYIFSKFVVSDSLFNTLLVHLVTQFVLLNGPVDCQNIETVVEQIQRVINVFTENEIDTPFSFESFPKCDSSKL